MRGKVHWHDGGWRAQVTHGKFTVFAGPKRKPVEKKKAEDDLRRMLSAPGGIDGVRAVKARLMSEARADRAAAAAADAAEEERQTAAAEEPRKRPRPSAGEPVSA